MSVPQSPASASYHAHLRSRWASRIELMCAQGTVVAFLWAALEWLGAREAGHAYGWAQLLPRIAPVLIAPVCVLGGRLARSSRPLPLLGMSGAFLFTLLSDAAFFVQGTGGSLLHGVVFYVCVLSVCTVLPMEQRERRLLFAAMFLAHLALELGWPDGRTLPRRLLACAQVGTGVFTLMMVLELFFQSHARNFALRHQMGSALQALSESQGRILEASSTLAASVSQLSDSTRVLSGQTESTEAESLAMAGAVERMAQSAQALLARSHTSAVAAGQAGERAGAVDGLVGEVEQRVQELDASVGASEERLQVLLARFRSIDSLAEDIRGIAARTHMLALNARIEATRAGERGQGFVVVAAEVRKLAGQVVQSSQRVQGVVAELRSQMDSVVDSVGQVRTSMRELQADFGRARASLGSIQAVMQDIQEATQASARDADAQAQGTRSISGGTARLLDLVRAQTRMSADVARTTDDLNRLADSLRGLLPAQPPP